jgi:hypothetical protein
MNIEEFIEQFAAGVWMQASLRPRNISALDRSLVDPGGSPPRTDQTTSPIPLLEFFCDAQSAFWEV